MALPFRPLLCVETRELTLRHRWQKAALKSFLALPDRGYRQCFQRLRARLRQTSDQRRAAGEDVPREPTLLMIGSLDAGGAQRQLVATLKGLLARGDRNVAAACTNLSAPPLRFFLPELEAAGIPVSLVGTEPEQLIDPEVRSMIEQLPFDLRNVMGYAATLSAKRPRIAHLWLDEENCKGGIAAVLTGVPRIILSQRNLPPYNFGFHHPYMREAYRWLARAPGVVMINNSAAGARAYEDWLGLPRGTIGVVHNGFAFDEAKIIRHRAARGNYRHRIGIPANVPLIGTVNRLAEEKRPFLWLEVAANIHRAVPDSHFLMLGDGPLRCTLEKRAHEIGLGEAIHFTGNERDVFSAMVDMDLLLLMSRVEGLPNVLIEAQVLGIPVVTTPAGGAPEAVDHNKSGWVLESEDSSACADRVIALLKDRAWRKRAASYGPGFALSRFGMQRAIDETLAAYGDMSTAAHRVSA
jgi:glycosyltransferase involved in cell wall biosynthesis